LVVGGRYSRVLPSSRFTAFMIRLKGELCWDRQVY
jgi:hypothetical protein